MTTGKFLVYWFCRKHRNQKSDRLNKVHNYEMVEKVNSTKSKPTVEIVPDLLISEASALTANPPPDNVHDHSENENNAANKRSVKNVLYEQGRTHKITSCIATLQFHPTTHAHTHMYISTPKATHSSVHIHTCLLYTSPSPRDATLSRMPSSA